MSTIASMATSRPAAPPEPAGLAARRVAAELLEGVLLRHRPLDEQLDGAAAHRASPRSRNATAHSRAAWSRPCCGGSARCVICSGCFSTAAFRLKRRGSRPRSCSARRRSCGSTCPTMRRSISRCGSRAPTGGRALCRPGATPCFAGSRQTAPNVCATIDRPAAALDTPAWLMARWTKELRRRNGPRHRSRPCARAGRSISRSRAIPAHWADGARRPGAGDRHGARERAWAGIATARLCGRRLVGAGCGCGASGAAPRRCRAARPSPTCARRPAARPRSSPLPAPTWSRSTAPKVGSCGCGRTSPGSGLTAETVAADVAALAAPGPSTRCCSMRPARRPAPSAATRTSPGSSARPTSRRWRRRSARSLARAVELTRPGGVLVYCTCSLEPEEGVEIIDELLARDSRLRRLPIAPAEVARPWRIPHRGRRLAHASLPTARSRSTNGRN